jgi:hypothetical protein
MTKLFAKASLRICFLVLATGLFLGGCATSKGSYSVVIAPKEPAQLQKYTDLLVEVQCNEDVLLTDMVKTRIQQLVVINIKKAQPDRFKTINQQEKKDNMLLASIRIKEYEKGNAFARLMLAGLGQIHIDSDVVLSDATTKQPLCTLEVDKRFAWGGAYGGTTRIEDIEDPFAAAVAEAILLKHE